MVCSDCGKELKDSNNYCPSCGTKISAVSGTPESIQSEKLQTKIAMLPMPVATSFLIIITGAIMMLAAIAPDWYTVNGYHYSDYTHLKHLGFDFFTSSKYVGFFDLNRLGATLPPFLIIVLASITILSAIYAVATGQRFKRFWFWLSLLSAGALIADFLYLLVALWNFDHGFYVTPHAGWVLAFIGAVAIGIGSRKL